MSKTYEVAVTKNKLEIRHYDCWSPREDDESMGKAITIHDRKISPDEDDYFIGVVKETGDIANNWEHHKELMKTQLEEDGYPVRMILPISIHEHGNSIYYISSKTGGWDTSFCGAYIVIKNSENNDLTNEEIKSCVDGEMKIYTQWVNGEVYEFLIHDEDGIVIDGCSGFYDIDDIMEFLPKEYKEDDLFDYLVH